MPGPEILRAIDVSLLGVLPTFRKRKRSNLSMRVLKQRWVTLKRKMKRALIGASRTRLSVRRTVRTMDLSIWKMMPKMGRDRTTNRSGIKAD